jgi:hypothetical protein
MIVIAISMNLWKKILDNVYYVLKSVKHVSSLMAKFYVYLAKGKKL